jgi:hypothetical protein
VVLLIDYGMGRDEYFHPQRNEGTLRCYYQHKANDNPFEHIGVRSDSTTAVAYVNDMGGMSSVLLDKLSAEIWSWCSQRNIFITAQFLPGIHNFGADHMSRNFTDSTEWKLKRKFLIDLEVKCQGPTKVITVCDTPSYGHAPTYEISLTYLERQKSYGPDKLR